MEGRTDAQIARDRCIEALAGSTDPAERLALWKAAKRYGEKHREDVARLEIQNHALPGRTQFMGGGLYGCEV